MKKPFMNPVFQFLNGADDPNVLMRMGFDSVIALPELDTVKLEAYGADPDKFFREWDLPEEAVEGFTLSGIGDWGEGPFALYVQPLTPFAEELLALGLRHMRTAEYATLAKRPSRQRDWVGNHVQLKRKVSNENTAFPAGLIMKVVGSYRGLTLETVELYKPSGVFVKHRISRVPVDWVDLVVVPFEGGHE